MMSVPKIAVLPGDGIGTEVMAQALKVLAAVRERYDFPCVFEEGFIGGAAYERFGTPLPEETLTLCRESDAVFLGSIGGPRWDHLPPHLRPELGGLLALRKVLKLYANLRPARLFPALQSFSPLATSVLKEPVDILTVRELSGGIYFGKPKELTDNMGLDTMIYERSTVERITRVAFQLARQRRKKVTSVDKANVLYSSMLWRQVVEEVSLSFPDVQLENMYVDNAAMQLIMKPGSFDVLLTTNLFGDILSDESAAVIGTLGMLPSASLGEGVHLYEPAGGSAPDIAGLGVANPIAQILSGALMLEYSFQRTDISRAIFSAVERVLESGYRTRDIAGPGTQTLSTAQMGDKICQHLQ